MDYLEYRRTYFKRKLPTNDILIRDRSTLLGVFRYAKNKGYIVEIPNFTKPQAEEPKSDTWTEEEYKNKLWNERLGCIGKDSWYVEGKIHFSIVILHSHKYWNADMRCSTHHLE